MLSPRATRWLYVAAVVLLIVPIWCVAHMPTVDGPSHLYNAEIIRHIARGDDSAMTHAFRINHHPVPNWSGHFVLALLMTLVAPAIAEKLLMTGIIVLFMTGVWMYAGCDDEQRRVYAFVAIPLAYNQLFQYGFYNYALSVGVSLVTIAWWWRHRKQHDMTSIGVTSLLLVALYFSHPLTTALTIVALVLLWAATSREPLHLLMFLPVAPFLGWYVFSQPASKIFQPMPLSIGWAYLSKTQLLLTFDPRQLIFGRVYFALFLVLYVVTFIRQSLAREATLFLALAVLYLVLFYALNSNAAGGSFIHERLALAFMLAPLAWFTPRVPARALIVAFLLVAVAELCFLVKNYTHSDHDVSRFLASTKGVGTRSTLMPLLGSYDAKPGVDFTPIVKAINYAAIDRELVNLDNYEASTDYFPTVFAPSLHPNVFEIENQAFNIDAMQYAPKAEWVFVWKFSDNTNLMSQLSRAYALIASNGPGRVYRSRVISP